MKWHEQKELGDIFEEGILDRFSSKLKSVKNTVKNVGKFASGNPDDIINVEQQRITDYFTSIENKILKEVESMFKNHPEVAAILTATQLSFKNMKDETANVLKNSNQINKDETENLRQQNQQLRQQNAATPPPLPQQKRVARSSMGRRY